MAYIELTDQGWLQSRDQLTKTMALLQPKPGDARPVEVTLFVHGWKHSASADDRDVDEFRRTVLPAFAARAGQNVRTVGIYVGWRGESINVHTVRNLTFYDRKSTAEQVARGSIRELIARLRSLHRPGATTGDVRVNLIGHSFGGLIVFNSMAGSLLDTLIASPEGTPAAPVVNMVLLLNPAFEASRFEPMFQVARNRPVPQRTDRPVFVAITAENDLATRFWFPLGRRFGTLFDHEAWTDEDNCPGGRTDLGECWTLRYDLRLEHQTNLRTIGHLPRYFTHQLKGGGGGPVDCHPLTEGVSDLPLEAQPPAPPNELSVISPPQRRFRAELEAPNAPVPRNRFPLWSMRASASVIDNHSGIYKGALWAFIARLADSEPVDQLCPPVAK